MGGWSGWSLCSMENEHSWRRTCGYKDGEREREETPVGGRAPIHCVAHIFADLAWKVSAVPFRLSIVLQDFYYSIPQHHRCVVASHFPFVAASPFLLPGIRMFRSSFFSPLYPPPPLSLIFSQHVSSSTFSSPFTRGRLLIWNRAESISVFYRQRRTHVRIRVFVWNILVLVRDEGTHEYLKGKGKRPSKLIFGE